ncbi:phenylalanine--tRNA ligase subunit beta [Seleniivibrio woodruffii]|uniref:phenylalanine--tRNA ligase subunit beta n=1 Tax=Seleniivibrio woodruffii TaxID=1078050 RepID=UPI0026F05279|nr:phenylalanine--tRNA ligase subunit beta [Seleniivibrio woodruffii]
MKISINWINEFVDTTGIDMQELAAKLTMSGLEVESVETKNRLNNVVVAKVLKCEKHPDADKLSLCVVSTGAEEHQVVCGAPNVRAGQTVVFAMIGAELPGGFKIKKAKIRGIESCGMICAEDEIGLSDDHAGIMILPDHLEAGMDINEYLGFPDTVMEIGITPNRADCLSMVGYAREIAALYGLKLKERSWNLAETDDKAENYGGVVIENKEACPSYIGRVIKDVKIAPSPVWMQNRLRAVGVRPINNVVDVTNYVMFEYGQPLHTFDLREIDGKIIIRNAKAGEKLLLLDEKERSFTEEMLLITDEKKILALAGVMGGEHSGISDDTKDVFLECAYFEPKQTRKTARKLGMTSDAAYRYERGADPANPVKMVDYAAYLLQEVAGGKICKGKLGEYAEAAERKVTVDTKWINSYLGTSVPDEQIVKILSDLGLNPAVSGTSITVTAPSYRVDIVSDQDIAEEVARMYGYDNIPTTLPRIDSDSKPMSRLLAARRDIGYQMKTLGFNEAINYSFMKDDFLKLFDDEAKFVKLLNPISEDMNTLRTLVFPGLLANIKYNLNNGFKQARFFEFASSFIKTDRLPEQRMKFTAAVAGDFWTMSWAAPAPVEPFFALKGILENVLNSYKIKAEYVRSGKHFLHPGKGADVVVNGTVIGFIGELHPAVADEADIRENVVLFEIDMELLVENAVFQYKFADFSKFPSIYKDISVVVDRATASVDMINCIKGTSKLAEDAFLFDVYAGKGIEEGKESRTYRVYFTASDRTLTDEETNGLLLKMIENLTKEFGAILR